MDSEIDLGNTYLYHQLDEYPWDTDEEFQGGLSAILGSVQDPAQVEHLTLRAKCYYFARKSGTPVDFDGYKAWIETQRGVASANGTYDTLFEAQPQAAGESAGGDASGGMSDAPKPASFAEICALIQEGKPIPGIKEIPDTVLEGQASESQTEKRRKPWEKATEGGADEQKPSWMS
ncbi:uncharacterized protein LTR77_010539 [Saxophila tyrrhenica]|uniref:Uncharacterized protein n=1 Tax=Saxophila tyrrhenica TaxID=1690608 RepID=A0AAV9NV02_9PEZI|nr:hypothetical protein LTR77_010539 [Saxophila tyrrhenica]